MTDWQPIETAPKDGTCILVCDYFGTAIASWQVPGEEAAAEGCEPTWLAHSQECEEYLDPTYWQPLPEPPKAEARVPATLHSQFDNIVDHIYSSECTDAAIGDKRDVSLRKPSPKGYG